MVVGSVERLYREIRALRTYEGTSETHKLIIADQVLAWSSTRVEGSPGSSQIPRDTATLLSRSKKVYAEVIGRHLTMSVVVVDRLLVCKAKLEI